jgi:hypothetical protein
VADILSFRVIFFFVRRAKGCKRQKMPALTTYQAGDSDSEYGPWSGEWIEDSDREQDIESAGSEKDDNSRDERWCVDWVSDTDGEEDDTETNTRNISTAAR